MRSSPLATGFAALVAATVGLMTLGALVRAHGAGLACPDWPLCFGEVLPRFDFHVAFEVGHRWYAGGVALAFAGLALRTRREPAAWRAVRGGILLAAALLAGQVLLGALTVWKLLAIWTVTAHLLTANLFAITLLCVALRLRELGRPAPAARAAPGATRVLLPAAGALFAVQLVLGGLVSSSYAGLACPEWPTCADGAFLPAGGPALLHFAHRTTAYALLATLAAAALAARRDAGLARAAALALALCTAQVGVGIANVLLRLPVEITGLHSALAAALSLTLAFALRALWSRREVPLAARAALPQATALR
jgi:cytochrome c oxidase assembly protein subunit 15